jgi:ABC-type transport system involved in multi-copper enzyme maturation permease subunit
VQSSFQGTTFAFFHGAGRQLGQNRPEGDCIMAAAEIHAVAAPLEVRARVSWGAIVAGIAVTMAAFYILTALGAAIGLSAMKSGEQAESLGVGAAVWGFLTTLVALFLGGWTTSLVALGENKADSVIHALVLWGVVFTFIFAFAMGGLHMGISAVGPTTGAAPVVMVDEGQLRAVGINPTPDQMRELQARFNRVPEKAAPAAWWTFAALVVSLLVTVGGALAGAGNGLIVRSFKVPEPVTKPYSPPPPPPR